MYGWRRTALIKQRGDFCRMLNLLPRKSQLKIKRKQTEDMKKSWGKKNNFQESWKMDQEWFEYTESEECRIGDRENIFWVIVVIFFHCVLCFPLVNTRKGMLYLMFIFSLLCQFFLRKSKFSGGQVTFENHLSCGQVQFLTFCKPW